MIAWLIILGYFVTGLGVTWLMLPWCWRNARKMAYICEVRTNVLLRVAGIIFLWPFLPFAWIGLLGYKLIEYRDPRNAELKRKKEETKKLEMDKRTRQLERELGIDPKKT